MLLQISYWIVLFLCCGYAFRRGGRPERIGAAVALAASILSVAATTEFAARFKGVEAGILAVDVAVLCAFLALAVKTDRFWPLWATAFHTVAVATHIAIAADPTTVPRAYALAQGFWAYPVILSFAVGTWNLQRRLAQSAAAPSSSGSSPPSAPHPPRTTPNG